MGELAQYSSPKEKVGPSLLSKESLTGSQIGMLVAIASWAMLFGTLVLSLMLAKARVRVWPPIGSEPMPFTLTTLAVLATLD
jgi:heme/copper-type cytochrome/quinol oxidase subunit 3